MKRRRHVGAPDVAVEDLRHRRRPADIDLSFRDIGDQLLEMLRREQASPVVGRVVADDEDEVDPSLPRQLFELVTEDHVFVPNDAIDHDHVSGHVLHERANRRDPDSARDQDDPVAASRRFREDAERPFCNYGRPGSDLREPAREVPERFHGDAERATVRRFREREGVRGPPAFPVEEAPQEKLAWARVEPVEAAAGDSQRDDARALGNHLGHA